MKEKKLQIRNSTAEFLIFTGQTGEQSIEARYEDETIWLTQKLMAELFDVDVRTISEHLKNIFENGELRKDAVIRKFRITASDGKHYLTGPKDSIYSLNLTNGKSCRTKGMFPRKSPGSSRKASLKNTALFRIGSSRATLTE